MRKSTATNASEGNIAKADSYREAITRIQLADEQGFYIEATALIESMIGDRILSHLNGKFGHPLRTKKKRHHSFSSLIAAVRRQTDLVNEEGECVWTKLDEWRENRNEVIHGMVRSDPGETTIAVQTRICGYSRNGTISRATTLRILIIGLTAGPAVSL
jgi:hypothetical protein